ncbi:hypothetical protein FDP41_009246 [Naegleria fowleri]|uniref:Protein YIF1 n=1 Tax=Naegleria fowleri TaxID=5763 RepID=A0A6A5AX48_NAEFO|nr:uncharacterized protein FDP41_009246 [Naegleria fowleri]KAF0972343.1 hypothetical protein FDP41_009246 [Naegleria fowleri]
MHNDRRNILFDDVGFNVDPTSPTQSLDFFDSGFSSRSSVGGASSPPLGGDAHPSGAMDSSMNIHSTSSGHNSGVGGFGNLFGAFQGGGGNTLFQNPAADFMFNIGVNQIYDTVGERTNDMNSRYWQWFDGLKCYFNVTNSYVSRKLLMVLFPFKKFQDQSNTSSANFNPSQQGNASTTQQERHLNDPDFYIPLMGYITYVLLVCFIMGAYKEFKPDLLYSIGMKGFITSVLEISIVKFGFYFLGVPSSLGVLDVAAYSGYKYIGIILTLLLTSLFGTYVYYPALFIFSIMMSTFMIKSLRRAGIHSSDNSMRLRGDSTASKRNYFIFVVALLQIPFFFFLTFSYAKPLFDFVTPSSSSPLSNTPLSTTTDTGMNPPINTQK